MDLDVWLLAPINPPWIPGTKINSDAFRSSNNFVFTRVAKLLHGCVVACTGHDHVLVRINLHKHHTCCIFTGICPATESETWPMDYFAAWKSCSICKYCQKSNNCNYDNSYLVAVFDKKLSAIHKNLSVYLEKRAVNHWHQNQKFQPVIE